MSDSDSSESEKEPNSPPNSEPDFPGADRVAAASLLADRLELHPSPLPSPYSESQDLSQMSNFSAWGPVPRATEMGLKADEEARGEKRFIDVDGSVDGGVAKAVDDKQSFTYVGKYPSSEKDESVIFNDATYSAATYSAASSSAASSSAASSSGSFGTGLSNITLSEFNSEVSIGGQTPPHFEHAYEEEIDSNINDLLTGGGGLRGDGGRFTEAYESAMSGVDDKLLEILGIIKNCGKVGVKRVFLSAKIAGKNLYRILAFATASKLNLLIVLGTCGALYKNCPYAAYIFDFLISKTLPILNFLGDVTGFNDAILNLFNAFKTALGIDDLIALLASIKEAIPTAEELNGLIADAVKEAADAAKDAAAGVAGMTAANKARELIIDEVMRRWGQGQVAQVPGLAERLLNVAVSGVANGMGQTGVRSLIGHVLNAANPGFAALQNGGGKKRRRRTMRHKKRSQTKRRVKHGMRRQTKKMQNKRTKTRSKQ